VFNLKKIKTLLLALLGLVSAGYSMSAPDVLERLRVATTAKDRRVKAIMTITDRKRVQKRTLRLVMKGTDKLLVTFIEPADLRGVSFLTTGRDNMWVYLPAQGRVRRISGSAVDQSFGGSDFSYREMASISFGSSRATGAVEEKEWNGTMVYLINIEDGGEKSRLWVDRERFVPLRVDKLDQHGNVLKLITFSDFLEQDGVWIPQTVCLDNISRGSSTELKLLEVNLNTGIKDNYFTEDNMKRGG